MTGKKMGNSSGAAGEAVVGTARYFSTLVRRESFVYHASSLATSACRAPSGESGGHFLDECGLCRRPLGRFRDIFMYKGDVPFCSEECRQEQIAMDEAKEGREESLWSRMPRHGVPVQAAAAAARVRSVRFHAAEPAAA